MPPLIHSVLHIAKMTGVAGMENHLLTLLPGLKASGLEVRLLILVEADQAMADYAAQMTALGVPTSSIVIRGNFDWRLIGRLTRMLRESKPDAVHTHLIHADLHGVIAARRANIGAIFMTGHNDDPFRRRWPIRLLQRYLWQRVTRGIAISEAVRRFQITIEHAPSDRVITVPYGLDLSDLSIGDGARAVARQELGIPPQAPVFGSVCRLVEQKGIDDALRAFWQISRRLPDAHYAIIGDGPLRAMLEVQTAGYQLTTRVHFLGWRSDARSLMVAFDTLLAPSRWEGFGLSVLEAMAARVPVIAATAGALPEIVVNGETGYLVPIGDVDALAQAMLQICEFPAQSHEMGEAARQRVETKFSAARMVASTLQVYNPPAVV
jgi:glycosyltransferase involved in cell wall biosynthesis